MGKETTLRLFASNPAFSEYLITSHLVQYVEKPLETIGRRLLHFTSSNRLFYKTRIGDLAIKEVVTVQDNSTIQEAATEMSAKGVSSLVIVNQNTNPVGIITDRDLRQKVVAAGRNPADQVRNIMTSSLVKVDSQDYYFEAILKMLQHNIHHLIVMQNGTLKGVFSNHDLMILQGTSPLTIVRDIESQQTVESLIPESRNINGVISHLLTVAAKASEITKIITEINERLLRKLLELTENKLGSPPVPFCWIVFGSEGRKEQTYKTDQDNAILYADPPAGTDLREVDDYFSSLAEHMRDLLLQCGFPLCPGNYMASNPQWRQPLKIWEEYFSQWIATPTSEAVLASCIVFDFRPVYGDFTLAGRLKNHLLHKLEGQDIFLKLMAQLSIQVRPPVGFFRTFVVAKSGEYKNKLNLKFTCLAPIINIVRLFSLESRIPETSTLERIQALKNNHTIMKEFGDELEHAFEFISMLRIRLQHEQIKKGLEPDNYLNPKQLNAFEKKVFRESCRLIGKLQDMINKRYNPGTGSI
jgi:CBS domain-containing protein